MMVNATVELLKVSNSSNPRKVASFIAKVIKNGEDAVITSMGADAVNKSVKSVAIANGYMAVNGKMAAFFPSFTSIVIEEEERTAIKMHLFDSFSLIPDKRNVRECKVSATTNPSSLAGFVTQIVREGDLPAVTAIGADAVNQSIKGLAATSTFLAPLGSRIAIMPGFLNINGQTGKTGIRFYTYLL